MISPRVFAVCLMLVWLSVKSSAAQDKLDSFKLNIEIINANNGLSQGMVRSIIQDKDGFIWFATKDGLNKYDGYRMVVYRNNPNDSLSLPDNYVTQLLEDSCGNFWVGTATKGLWLFDKQHEQFKKVRIKSSHEPLDNISQLLYCNGSLLIYSHAECYMLHAGLLKTIHQQKTSYEVIPNVDFSSLYTHTFRPHQPFKQWLIGAMTDNRVWFWEKDSITIFSYSKNTNQWSMQSQALSAYGIDESIYSLYVYEIPGKNEYLFKTNTGIYIVDGRQNKVIFSKTFELNSSLFLSKSIHEQCYYISNEHNNYELNTHTRTLKKINLNRQDMNLAGLCSYIDANHTLWIGMNGQGVIKIEERKQKFNSIPQINTHLIRDVKEYPMFISKNHPLQFHPNHLSFSECLPKDYLNKHNYGITSLIQAKDSVYWFKGSKNGTDYRFILSYDQRKGRMKEYQIINRYPRQFESMFCDSKNNIWMIYIHNDQHGRLRQLDKIHDTILSEFIFPIKHHLKEYPFVSEYWEDQQGFFWFATTQGLLSLDVEHKRWRHWKNIPSNHTTLSNDVLFSICPDPIHPNQYLWLGTNGGGLNRFDRATGKCIHFNEKDGLPNNVVYAIVSDRQHHLWLSTNKGISCFDPTLNSFINFREKDGLVGDEFNRYEYWKSPKGDLYFGGVNGFTYFNPEDVLQGNLLAPIKLTGLSIFNTPIEYQTNSKVLDAPISYAKHITLNYAQNMFAIEFAYLNFSSPDTKKYKYRLEGFSNNWIDNGTDNIAKFTNLAPGDYTFTVTGCNSSDLKYAPPASIRITILPPWWGTWWFRLSALAAVIGAIYALYRYRLQQALNIYELRNTIASDLHDEIGSTLSSISISSTIIQQSNPQDSPETKKLLQQISWNTDTMMEAMSDIVWTINTKNDRFENVVSRMRAFAYELLEPQGCAIHFYADEQLPRTKLDMLKRKNLYLLFKEAIHNIAKYSGCKNVWIELKKIQPRQIMLYIKDDGSGFDVHSKHAGEIHFGGNGMANMKLRAQQMKSILHIHSSPGQGTEITLYLTI